VWTERIEHSIPWPEGETVKRKKQPSEASISEHEIQRQITDYLTLKGVFWYRNNTGAMKVGKSYVRFGVKGAPDLIAVVRGHYFGIEVKKPGKSISEAQAAFCADIRRAGGTYLVATCLEDVISWFEPSGVR
jgi:hypothetical protein